MSFPADEYAGGGWSKYVAASPRLYCTDPDCPDYGTPADPLDLCDTSPTQPPPLWEDPWVGRPYVEPSRAARVRHWSGRPHYLARRRITRNREIVVHFDFHRWVIGFVWFDHRGFAVEAGPLMLTVDEVPF